MDTEGSQIADYDRRGRMTSSRLQTRRSSAPVPPQPHGHRRASLYHGTNNSPRNLERRRLTGRLGRCPSELNTGVPASSIACRAGRSMCSFASAPTASTVTEEFANQRISIALNRTIR